jgi:RNA polymerase sigma factor (sigma-70 family)
LAACSTGFVAELYNEHHSWLSSWLDRRLGNKAEAADLAHDTFERVLIAQRKPPIVQAPEADSEAGSLLREPRPYLATVAKHVLINYLRRLSLERAFLDALATLPTSQSPSPEEGALVLEALQEVDAMLARLPSKVRVAFVMSQVEGWNYAEIAEQLKASERSVKRWMAIALAECIVFAPS